MSGKDGKDGQDGKAGQDGQDGKAGQDGQDGKAGQDGQDGKAGQDGQDGKAGQDGQDGKAGQDGKDGAPGNNGTNGIDGKDGAPGSGAQLPFSSNLPILMTTVLGGLLNTVSVVGPSSSATGINIVGTQIDLTGGIGIGLNVAPSMARAGTLTDICAYFSTTAALALVGSTATVTAQLWTSPTPNNTFTAVPGAIVTFATTLTGIVAPGTFLRGRTTGLVIPITAETRYMLVFRSAITGGLDLATVIAGYSGGGISVS